MFHLNAFYCQAITKVAAYIFIKASPLPDPGACIIYLFPPVKNFHIVSTVQINKMHVLQFTDNEICLPDFRGIFSCTGSHLTATGQAFCMPTDKIQLFFSGPCTAPSCRLFCHSTECSKMCQRSQYTIVKQRQPGVFFLQKILFTFQGSPL